MGRLRIDLKRPYIGVVICLLLGMSLAVNYFGAPLRSSSSCPPLSAADWTRVKSFLKFQFGSGSAHPEITTSQLLPGSCISRVVVKEPSTGRSGVWFLSEDHRYIFSRVADLSLPLTRNRNAASASASPVNMSDLLYDSKTSTGPVNAPIVIVEFSDFQCPYCRRAATALREDIFKSHKDDVRLIFRNYPLSFHRSARSAAELGACIAKQSADAFWVYHDEVFAHPERLTSDTFPQDSLRAVKRSSPHLNTTAVLSCLSSHEAAPEVEADIQLGNKYGVSGTPTLFVNGQRIAGIRDAAYLEQIISRQSQLASN